ncbi:MDR family oxidoreductase [Novosphingobium sp.]|jgi:acrylyl-CoA reductase (NADPH)|uniref:MDR family oxidoreductase n=1 Tax=Novosphingobium sp. TaxID=1874826 RepID=UPI0022C39AE0|nr:MDR family oxidoreductase [Novosphingobium sp.]MCZ8018508.1 oxidoreductase [Novosphingobium sp.]MCZ8033502.1 oxidoreductase [Novosphingobium sp.]MCZ8051957.1 oxidoreductase [Novosphingobium sp.]MCZ8060499.1 oxidoreductase [Novosphingobium sp.]MCZ8232141.1 oxidoreductase [Novosphingobium sp.]
MTEFNAIVAREVDRRSQGTLETLTLDDLPDRDVLVKIDYSSLNYKDALAVSGRGKICRSMPMVCGIDLAGTIAESAHQDWKAGDRVVINGFGMSETVWGGYSQYQRVSSDWLVRLPEAFAPEQAMAIGTAGYTAMLCVHALQDHGVTPGDGRICVSGASGGVGSVALLLLAKLGYQAVAVSGRPETEPYLRELGAVDVIDRAELDRDPRPLEKEVWAAGIDCVGSKTLATMLAQTRYEGIVAACGLAGGADLPTTVMPFILRGVTLRGVDSVMAAQPRRQRAWDDLARLVAPAELAAVFDIRSMSDLPKLATQLLDGQLRGRIVIDVNR